MCCSFCLECHLLPACGEALVGPLGSSPLVSPSIISVVGVALLYSMAHVQTTLIGPYSTLLQMSKFVPVFSINL